MAQNSEAPSQAAEIVVTGIRGSLQRSIDVKRDAPTVVDAISSEDVGKFPDINVAESVQRISGVQINRQRGEGRSVNIRGLPASFTLATLNGRTLPSALGGFSRSFDFQILPPEFIRTLEVYKASTADLEEGGLSGMVNIKTPRALDIGRRVIRGQLQTEYDDNSGAFAPRASAMYADSLLDNRLGLTLGVSYLKRNYEVHGASSEYEIKNEKKNYDLNGDGKIEPNDEARVPGLIRFNNVGTKSERLSAVGSLQFEASDALTLYTDAFYSKLDTDSVDFVNLHYFSNSSTVKSTTLQDVEGVPTATTFRVADLDLRQNGRQSLSSGYVWSAVGGFEFKQGAFTAKLDYARSESRQKSSDLNIANRTNHAIDAEYSSASKGIGSVTYFGDAATKRYDADFYRLLSANGTYMGRQSDVMDDVKLDASYKLADKGLTRIAFGGKWSDRHQYKNNARLTVNAQQMSDLWQQATGAPLPLVPGTKCPPDKKGCQYSAAPFLIPVVAGNGAFAGSYSGDATFPTDWIGSNLGAFTGKFSADELIAGGDFTNEPTGIIDVSERIYAAYARADFDFDRIDGNVGLRWVRTRQQSVGVSPDLAGITVAPDAGNVTTVPTGEPVNVTRTYTKLLPSFNLRYRPNDKLLFRAAASRTISRPELNQISPTITVNAVGSRVTEQNPYLNPFLADNLDFTAEWYFRPGSLLGASLFYKNLKSLIRPVSEVKPLTIIVVDAQKKPTSTEIRNFTFNSLANGDGVKLKGIELYLQTNFDFLASPFLSGFGTQLNYTYIDNSDPEQLTAASPHNFNATLFYEKGPLGVRMSYSWRDRFLTSPSQLRTLGNFNLAYGTLDGSINFAVNENISLVFEAVNILDEDEISEFSSGFPQSFSDAGRRIQGGIRLSF